MEPIKITATKTAEGIQVEAYDAADLFEQASKALSDKRFDDAIGLYDRLLKEFKEQYKDGRYTRATLYNVGLAHQGKKDWDGAIARFKELAENFPDSSDSKDALFQLGDTYAEVNNWPASAQVFSHVLERKDLTSDDRLEAMARRGFAQFQLRDLDTAERTFRSAVAFFHEVEAAERLETDFFLALSMYHLGQVMHERFRAISLRLPEKQMSADLDEKARLLLLAQRQYIDTIKLGNGGWASAAGFQIASLFEELYDSFIHAPVPPELLKPEAKEELEVYHAELRKKIRILLEKSGHTHEANLAMMERLGVQNEWRDKTRLAYAKIQLLLDPSYRPDFSASPSGPTPGAPPLPTAPGSRTGTPDADPGQDGDVNPADRDRRVRPAPQSPRQIL